MIPRQSHTYSIGILLGITMLLTFAALGVSCSGGGVEFRRDTTLSEVETQNLTQQTGWVGWRPEYTAAWVENGITSRVCIAHSGLDGFRGSHIAFVFGSDGQVLEGNVLPTPNGVPKAVVAITPLRVRFSEDVGRSWIENGRYPSGEGISEFRRRIEEAQDMVKLIEKWKASGNTNLQDLQQILREAKLGRRR